MSQCVPTVAPRSSFVFHACPVGFRQTDHLVFEHTPVNWKFWISIQLMITHGNGRSSNMRLGCFVFYLGVSDVSNTLYRAMV